MGGLRTLFSACWDDALPILPPSFTRNIPPFTSAFFPFRQQAARHVRRHMEKAVMARRRQQQQQQQVHSAAAQQSAETDRHIHTEAAYGPGILPHPVQPPSFPFLFPLPLTPSPSPLPASPAPFHSLPARLRSPLPFAPCIGTVVYLPGRTAYHVPAPFSVMIYWLPPSATLEAPAFNWRTLYTTVADTHQPGLYHSA